MQLDAARIGARDREQALDEQREPVDFFQHASDRVPVIFPATVFLKRDFADAANRGERRAQLVRCIGGKAAELLERLFKPRE